ncbi:MAG: DNA polymerase III subunit beta [Pseudohongiellaceae bacterium]|nr:DNA polymerase III subunit beta [Pseudohongiellaceae bacterium]
MYFEISREAILKPLQLVSGVVERRQTLPVLSNVLLVLDDSGQLAITGTDLEVELVGSVKLEGKFTAGEITVPARKLVDICKSLSDDAMLHCSVDEQKMVIKSGRSRFSLATLPAAEFPNTEDEPGTMELALAQGELKKLLDGTAFAMAQQDVRYYLNGMLFELAKDYLRVVATDGHRLAMQTMAAENNVEEPVQLIVPRKGVVELGRLLVNEEESVSIVFGRSHVRARTADYTFTSKLVDGKFPDYNRVLPKGGDKIVIGDTQELKQAFTRTSILSNEKYRGIRMLLSEGEIKIIANNPDQEEAEESVSVDYSGEALEVGFNVSYLLDVLSVVNNDKTKITLLDSNSSALLEPANGSGSALYVVMPLRL